MYHHLACSSRSSSPSSVNATPSSSPTFGPVDSSPPSSPNLTPFSLDSPPRPTNAPFSHPFAASTKFGAKRLPSYEKKLDSPPCTPPGTFTRTPLGRVVGSRSLQEDDFMKTNTDDSPSASPLEHRTLHYVDREERIWEGAIRKPFDTGIGQIDLSNQQLRSIHPCVGDLVGFFNTPELSEQGLFSGRALVRVHTELALQSARVRSFERTQSIQDSGKERHVLKLYLMGNMITTLPRELFSVTNLTVLSLRGNKLTSIPPEICRLVNLRELNISNNQLNFLPWQMRDMKIEKLMVNPNPFLPEPLPSPSSLTHGNGVPRTLRSRRSLTRIHSLRKEALLGTTKPVLSPIALTPELACVLPLTELCYRILLAPSSPSVSSKPHTVLAEYYDLPLSDEWSIPQNVCNVLVANVPGVLRPRKRFSVDTVTRGDLHSTGVGMATGTCPNPAHEGQVFVKHAVEQFSWERRIAGVDVGGVVPLRWWGCLATCLDFLNDEMKEATTKERNEEIEPRYMIVGASTLDSEDDADMDMAVQAVDLAGESLDMDDFDD